MNPENDMPSPVSPVEPHELLKSLDSMLGVDGDIKSVEDVDKLLSYMKESNKLVNRCVYLNILKATKKDDILGRVVSGSGWDSLNIWLQDAKAEDNVPFLTELLKVYAQLPVTVDILKRNSCAKTIKQLGKLEDDTIKTLSSQIVDTWMAKIKAKPSGGESSSDKSSKRSKRRHHHHHHHGDKHSPSASPASSPRHNGDNDADNKGDSKDQNSHRHHSNSSASSSSSSTNKSNRDKNTSRASPSSGVKDASETTNADDKKSKARPRTVKTVGTKLRSTGNLKGLPSKVSSSRMLTLTSPRDLMDTWLELNKRRRIGNVPRSA